SSIRHEPRAARRHVESQCDDARSAHVGWSVKRVTLLAPAATAARRSIAPWLDRGCTSRRARFRALAAAPSAPRRARSSAPPTPPAAPTAHAMEGVRPRRCAASRQRYVLDGRVASLVGRERQRYAARTTNDAQRAAVFPRKAQSSRATRANRGFPG